MILKRMLLVTLLPLLVATAASAQDRRVTGRVTDSKGQPVAGATVTVRGGRSGTMTSTDGTFTLTVPNSARELTVSDIGYASQNIAITDGVLSVSLITSENTLNDVVVVAYGGPTRRSNLASSEVTVRAKDFNQGVITSPDQLIQGKVAGLQIVANNGAPGAATTIRIRGNSSIRSGNNPLYVVDGIPLDGRLGRPGFSPNGLGTTPDANPLYFFNGNDIASMQVLKDAASTAIFGSRGANGVVLINTKNGISGPARIEVSGGVGVSTILRKIEVLNADEFRGALKTYSLTSGDKGANVNALDEVLQTAITQNYHAGISGGSENGRYRVGLGFLDQEGIVKGSSLRRFSVNATGKYTFLENRRLTVDFNVFAAQAKESIAPITNDAGFQGNLVGMALQWNPTEALYKPDGSLNITPGSSTVNPAAMLRGYEDKSDISSLFGIVGVGYKLTEGLNYKFNLSYNRQQGQRRAQMKRYITIPGIENQGLGFNGNSQLTTSVLQHILNFNRQVTTDLNLTVDLGYEWQRFGFQGSNTSGLGFANDDVPFYNILQNSTAANRNIGSFQDPSSDIQSYFVRAAFNFKDKYNITGTYRADGSSRFGSNNKYGYFPSIAAAWTISNEDFLKGNSTIQNLRLRGSWGITGNQSFPAGAAQTQWAYAGNGGGLVQQNVANPDLKWESTEQANVGLDFNFAKNRFYGSVDYFTRTTRDILFAFSAIQPAPAVTVWQNIPDATIKNSGVELQLGSTVINRSNFTWDLGVNATFLENEFNGYSGPPILTGAINGQGLSGAFVQRIENGQPLNAFWTRRFTGLDQAGNGTYANNEANEYVGNPNPKTLLGINSNMTYKKLTFGFNFNGAFGHQIYNNTLNAAIGIGNLSGGRNIAKSLLDLSPRENTSNAIKTSSRYLESGDFLRLSNVNLSYNLGNLGKNIRNASIFVTGQNLFIITKFTGFDPEVNVDKNIGGVPSFGIEYIPYPSARTIQLGVRASL